MVSPGKPYGTISTFLLMAHKTSLLQLDLHYTLDTSR
jgi:hypothetical protein